MDIRNFVYGHVAVPLAGATDYRTEIVAHMERTGDNLLHSVAAVTGSKFCRCAKCFDPETAGTRAFAAAVDIVTGGRR